MFSTAKQLRVARSLLGWTQQDLALQVGLSKDTIRNIEGEKGQPKQETVDRILRTFELAGIEFIKNGVKEADAVVRMNGAEGFWDFLTDVYGTIKKYGSPKNKVEVFLSNVVHQNWITAIGEAQWKLHADRMLTIKDRMDVRILVKENDWHFPAQSYAQYKWVTDDQFNDRSFYSYHDKLAFLNFQPNDVQITIMRQAEFAEGYRTLFRNTWEYVAKLPPSNGDHN
ncbi:MAG: helix-turn-helix transcriptional regulator [Bacteroidota bacterium]